MIQIQMEPTLHDELVSALYDVPILQKRESRDIWLASIPGHDGWNRVDGNDIADLSKVVEYLKHTFLGDVEDENTWALVGFIDRAYRAVEGTSKAKDLRNLRLRCVQCLKKTLPKQTPPPVRNTLAATVNILPQQSLLDADISDASSLVVAQEKETFPEQDLNFFELAPTYLIEARQRIFEADTFFEAQLFVYVTPAQKRRAVICLEAAVQQFEQLLQLLHGTTQLPQEIASHHQHFVDQINYLIEQFQMLVDWINKDKAADSALQETFTRIKKALQIFMAIDNIKGTLDSNYD